MNFEHLLHKLIKKFPDKKLKIFWYVKQLHIKHLNRQKLKLGSLTFDIKEFKIAGFKIYEILDIRFTRQDNTQEDSIKIDTRLNELNWKWNFFNILSFLIILTFILFFLYNQLYFWYELNFSFINSSSNKYDLLLKYSFDLVFKNNSNYFKNFFVINSWLNDTLLDFCNQYNILK